MKTELLYSLFKGTGVSTDTRTLKKGELFFALWGETYNGNKYAAEAIEKGASYAVIDDPDFETEKTILVDDCLLELQALASHYRKELKASVLAITGTNGKTTTKELIAAVLAKKFRVHYTKGNLNNHIGVPLTILRAPVETEIMIIEMGANHPGEIKLLSNIARPDYGIITNVGTAHLEGFGSFEGVLKSKSELYEYLRSVNGIALYNDQDHVLSEKIFKLVNRAVPYSDPTGLELIVEAVPSALNLKVIAIYQKSVYNIQTNLFGEFNLENVKAAIATGLFLGVEMQDIANAIGNYLPGNNRSELRNTKSNIIICDSYNANPTSMALAIQSFTLVEAAKKVLILGDMLELGEKGDEEHTKILDMLDGNYHDVLLVGPQFQHASRNFEFKTFPDVNRLSEYLKVSQIKDSTVLIKGSHGMALEKIYDLL
jgi:UDP-N-acetylmuramoyl-tripeptide--D-alanyl-D-alanine ligase